MLMKKIRFFYKGELHIPFFDCFCKIKFTHFINLQRMRYQHGVAMAAREDLPKAESHGHV